LRRGGEGGGGQGLLDGPFVPVQTHGKTAEPVHHVVVLVEGWWEEGVCARLVWFACGSGSTAVWNYRDHSPLPAHPTSPTHAHKFTHTHTHTTNLGRGSVTSQSPPSPLSSARVADGRQMPPTRSCGPPQAPGRGHGVNV